MSPVMKTRGRIAVAVVSLVLVATGLSPAAGAVPSTPGHSGVGPAGSWVVPTGPGADPWNPVPRDQVAEVCGLDPDLLEAAESSFGQAFSIVRFGELCWTGGGGAPATDPYHVWSVSKTFGATLVGMVAARSSLSDTDLASDWLTPAQMGTPSIFTPTPINPDATIAHMLGTTSTKSNLAVDEKGAWAYDLIGSRELNRLVTVINAVIAAEPENFPGVANAQQFAQQELFDVLGMQSSSWAGSSFGISLNTSVHDMARLGELWLRKGNWNGVQLIEEEYVYRMLHPSFADTNPGYGYATWLNSATLVSGIAGTQPDNVCAPYTTWPEFPHEPFFETTHDYGGTPFENEKYDIGVATAAGLGGQIITVHRGLDLVLVGRDVGTPSLWNALRPALVALDPVFAGDEEGFCEQYRASAYAPNLISGWAPRNREGCLEGGWRYGPWRDQGQCVSSFARGG